MPTLLLAVLVVVVQSDHWILESYSFAALFLVVSRATSPPVIVCKSFGIKPAVDVCVPWPSPNNCNLDTKLCWVSAGTDDGSAHITARHSAVSARGEGWYLRGLAGQARGGRGIH